MLAPPKESAPDFINPPAPPAVAIIYYSMVGILHAEVTTLKLMAKYYRIDNAEIGEDTIVRDFVNLYGCKIGRGCRIAAFVEIQRGVVIGDRCKVEAFAFIPSGVTVGDEVFIGPHVCFTNDRIPNAVGEWEVVPTVVKNGASIGANATVLCGVTIGKNALVGAGAVVTKDVPDSAVAVGCPARIVGSRDATGKKVTRKTVKVKKGKGGK